MKVLLYFLIIDIFVLPVYLWHTATTSSTPQHCDKNSDDCGSGRSVLKPVDCDELLQLCCSRSGVYNIWPKNKLMKGKSIEVFCDMATDKGGWTVIQRRGDYLRPNEYFYKDWADYKLGFGDIERDFWLGNDNIFALTNQRTYSVRFDFTTANSYTTYYALYDYFFIESEENKYKLHVEGYSGDADDSMTFHTGQKFSTRDQDNDDNANISCAVTYTGGWWYGHEKCYMANLNGLYLQAENALDLNGSQWNTLKGSSLVNTEIKIRPKDFRKDLIN